MWGSLYRKVIDTTTTSPPVRLSCRDAVIPCTVNSCHAAAWSTGTSLAQIESVESPHILRLVVSLSPAPRTPHASGDRGGDLAADLVGDLAADLVGDLGGDFVGVLACVLADG